MEIPSLTAAVRRELLGHPEVTERTHRFGGIVFHLGRRELGHLHGETVADLPLAPHIRAELVASGRIPAIHVAPDSDWVSRRVNRPEDVAEIVELFQISYEHAASEAVHDSDCDEEPDEAVQEEAIQHGAAWRELLAVPFRPFLHRRSRR